MKIRFLRTIATARGGFRVGQVIEVAEPTPDMLAWLTPLPDGTRRAEVVREDDADLLTATAPVAPERAVRAAGRRGRQQPERL